MISTAAVVTAVIMFISFLALYYLDETFGKDLDYLEENIKKPLKFPQEVFKRN
jgi:hypothetical protein